MTKKAFIEELATSENVLIGVGNTRRQLNLNKNFILDCEGTLNGMYKVEWRKCTYRGATKLTFSDGSTLGLDQQGKHKYYEVVPQDTENYFKVKKYLIIEHVWKNVDFVNHYKYIIYAVR